MATGNPPNQELAAAFMTVSRLTVGLIGSMLVLLWVDPGQAVAVWFGW